MPLLQEELIDSLIMTEGCVHRKAMDVTKAYEATNCKKLTTNITLPKIQLKHNGEKLLVNCQGRHITLKPYHRHS